MPLEFKRSWSDEDVERFRDSWVRFVESEMLPHDAEARRLGHVGHELWSRAGELGFLCVDIPEEWGGAGGDFRHEAVLHEDMARRALSGMSIGVHFNRRPLSVEPWHRRPEAPVSAAPRQRRTGWRDSDDRAGRRIGSPGDPHARRAARQPVRNQWFENLHLERLSRRVGSRRLQDRSSRAGAGHLAAAR